MADINSLIENYVGEEIFPLLSIIFVANSQHYEPTISEITALFYEKAPTRYNPLISMFNSRVMQSTYPYGLAGEVEQDSQKLVKYLENVGWIKVNEDNRIRITSFGKSLIRGISEQTENEDSGFSTIFKADDPFVYGKLFQALSDERHELLVDPYFKFNLIYLFKDTSIRKFIIRDKVENKENKEIKAIQFGLWRLQEQGQNNYEFRIAKSKEMHDRFLKDKDGKVYTLGVSINGIGKHTSMMIECPKSLQSDASTYVQRLWESATPIKPEKPTTTEESENHQH
ncbi:hypothetical protein BAAM0483_09175 [Bifidobacterium animalis subsp. animalis MCC 0483]|uniref:Uncharacterized protein n=1 Tax=Bifidobacterium animalis subsp. animalis MCC 0483 TaxID=1365955 RepID=A0AB34T694_9BIFI|nr:hypothetical protein [Bifidobacterium animalis]KOA47834.1 hypothetical protein BAAM0483_09175 [Bifidobacterium animalis subsp. animalis MCC 0483]